MKKQDIAEFEFYLESRLFELNHELLLKKYCHQPYTEFYICDPKLRHIHKASVRDRIVHQAVFRILYPIFDKHFIYDSYSSRLGKGTHLGVSKLQRACRAVSGNWRLPAYTLKCDIRKFFDSIDHQILREIITKKITDQNTLWLINNIISSFENETNNGLPLGNVTSQLFANIYLNELDQFIKHVLKCKYYLRYCDDFVILNTSKYGLVEVVPNIIDFLSSKLNLTLNIDKIIIRKVNQGIDFLGYVVLPHYTVLRIRTKKRMYKKIKIRIEQLVNRELSNESFKSSFQSYLGMLSHCRSYKIRRELFKIIEHAESFKKIY